MKSTMSQEIKLLPVIGYGCAFIIGVGNLVNKIKIIIRILKKLKVFFNNCVGISLGILTTS